MLLLSVNAGDQSTSKRVNNTSDLITEDAVRILVRRFWYCFHAVASKLSESPANSWLFL